MIIYNDKRDYPPEDIEEESYDLKEEYEENKRDEYEFEKRFNTNE